MLLDLRFLWESSVTTITGTATLQAIAQVGATGTVPVVSQLAAHTAAAFRRYSGGVPANEDVLLALWASGDLTDDEVLQILGVTDKAVRKLLLRGS